MTHLSQSFWVHTTSKCSDKSSCAQTKVPCEKLCFCFEMKILPFSGILSEVRSIVEITKGVQSKILDHKFLELGTYQPPPPLLSLSAHRSWYTSIVHLVLTSRVYCFFVFYLFRYSLITIHSVKKNSTRTAVGVILNTLWCNAPMFYHLWCQTNAALMRTSTNNPLFSSNCTTWLTDVNPTWSDENTLELLHLVPLDLQFCHLQRHVREHVNIFQWPLHVMDACQNCVTMDAMAGNQGTKQKCTN